MHRLKKLLLPLLLVLCLTACGGGTAEGEGYVLYFLSRQASGPALTAVPYDGEADPTPRQLLTALLAGPDELTEADSPFPAGVALRSCRLEEGVLYVDLTENYGGLTGSGLTLADYAITLTACQLEGVDGVCVTAAGQALSYRSHQVLTPEEVLSSGMAETE